MPLVAYADSGDDEEEADSHQQATEPELNHDAVADSSSKRQRPGADSTSHNAESDLPPLPTSFHDLYAANVRTGTSDDPSLHGGRKRQIPHVEGNWPTHVYLEWHPKHGEAQLLQTIITRITDKSPKVRTLLHNELSVPLPLHISLSRSLVLHTDKRDEFLSRVRRHVKNVGVKPFAVTFAKIAWYPNHDKTRWFLSLSIQKPKNDELNRLLGASNAACVAMEQPPLYVKSEAVSVDQHKRKKRRKSASASIEPDSEIGVPECSDFFHVSLAWSLEMQELDGGRKSVAASELEHLAARFDCVKVKMGNAVTSLPLASTKLGQSGKGLLG